jgi:hypothetical protein
MKAGMLEHVRHSQGPLALCGQMNELASSSRIPVEYQVLFYFSTNLSRVPFRTFLNTGSRLRGH